MDEAVQNLQKYMTEGIEGKDASKLNLDPTILVAFEKMMDQLAKPEEELKKILDSQFQESTDSDLEEFMRKESINAQQLPEER